MYRTFYAINICYVMYEHDVVQYQMEFTVRIRSTITSEWVPTKGFIV